MNISVIEIDLNTIIDAQRKNTNTPEWNELEAMLIEKKAVIDFSTLDNSDTPLAIQMIKWFFIHLPESILTNYRLRAFKDALGKRSEILFVYLTFNREFNSLRI
jgi:hypothetical protein